MADLAYGRPPPHAAGRGGTGAGRHRAGVVGGIARLARLRRRAARRALHPGRHQPLQRLLRRAPRRRHRGAARAGAGDRRRAGAATAGADRHLRQLRARHPLWDLPDRGGAASILAGVLYTGGPRPYGYEGLGEVFVFTFFGLVAVTGSYYVQRLSLEWEAFALAVPVGLLASAILVVNNVRDLDTDRQAGKRTLAVRLGRERTRHLFTAMIVLAYATALVPWLFGSLGPWVLLILLTLPIAVPLVRTVSTHSDGPTLNEALARTGMLEFAFCVLLSAGVLIG
jgi:hypothetical protein